MLRKIPGKSLPKLQIRDGNQSWENRQPVLVNWWDNRKKYMGSDALVERGKGGAEKYENGEAAVTVMTSSRIIVQPPMNGQMTDGSSRARATATATERDKQEFKIKSMGTHKRHIYKFLRMLYNNEATVVEMDVETPYKRIYLKTGNHEWLNAEIGRIALSDALAKHERLSAVQMTLAVARREDTAGRLRAIRRRILLQLPTS